MKRKTFVLDASVLLYDSDSIKKFNANDIVIPLAVVEELDKMKRLPNDLGRNARAVMRFLGTFDYQGNGDWHEGLEVGNGSRVRIQPDIQYSEDCDFRLRGTDSLARILKTAYHLQKEGGTVVFVSKDFAARIKAEAVGIEAEDYENLKVPFDQLYTGIISKQVDKHTIDLFYRDGRLPLTEEDAKHRTNEYVSMTSEEGSVALGRINKELGILEELLPTQDLWGVTPRNQEQRCALDLLLREDVKLVSLVGQAGTGKTLLALSAALRMVFDEGIYSRILVSRPVVPLGRDIGYLPGSKEEKLGQWMQPIFDNLAFLCDSQEHEPNETLRWVMESKKLEMEAVTYIRGRSLPKMFIIIDEAQNLTPHEVKTIISRAGEGTKVVLAGDPSQIDNPYLDQESNGLIFTIDRFQDQGIYGHVFLQKTERSKLAAIAAEVM